MYMVIEKQSCVCLHTSITYTDDDCIGTTLQWRLEKLSLETTTVSAIKTKLHDQSIAITMSLIDYFQRQH